MARQEKIEKLLKMVELLQNDTITPQEVERLLLLMINSIKESRGQFENIAAKNLSELKNAILSIEKNHEKRLVNIENKSKGDFDKEIQRVSDKILELKAVAEELQSIEVKDGKDADEEIIVDRVLERIEMPEPDSAEDILEKLNSLSGKAKLDGSIVNLPEDATIEINGIKKKIKEGLGGSVVRNIYQLLDVNIDGIANGSVLKYNSSTQTWEIGVDGGLPAPYFASHDGGTLVAGATSFDIVLTGSYFTEDMTVSSDAFDAVNSITFTSDNSVTINVDVTDTDGDYDLVLNNGTEDTTVDAFTVETLEYITDLADFDACYSVHQLNPTETVGIRIKRASDSTEQDIGFLNGDCDKAAIETFCAGTTCVVVKWYDQSGNNRDHTEATAARQGDIYNGALYEDDTNDKVIFVKGQVSAGTRIIPLGLNPAATDGEMLAVWGINSGNAFDDKFILATATSSHYLGAADDASTSTTLHQNSGSPTYYNEDGDFSGTTRDNLHDFYADTGETVVEGARNINWSSWSTVQFNAYSSWQNSGLIGAVLIKDGALTSLERTNVLANLKNYYGIT